MLILLKKAKRGLINEGKTVKYLLYAIGEITLVVIGILIALKVNNVNLLKQYGHLEHQYYQTIKTQLLEDKVLLQGEIYSLVERKASYITGKEIIAGNDRRRMEELGVSIIRLIEYGDFRRKSSVYQTLVYSGEVKYLKNENILRNLQEIERSYEIIERLESIQGNITISHTAPMIFSIIDFDTAQILDPDAVFTYLFSNRFSIANRLINEKMEFFNHAISVIDNTLKYIDDELQAK